MTIALAFWGAILLALVVVSCSNIFSFEGKEQLALNHLQVTKEAAETIKLSLQYFIAKKKSRLLNLENKDDCKDKFILRLRECSRRSPQEQQFYESELIKRYQNEGKSKFEAKQLEEHIYWKLVQNLIEFRMERKAFQ